MKKLLRLALALFIGIGISFSTYAQCSFNAPFIESFSGPGTTIPSCWTQSATTGGPWVFNVTATPDFGSNVAFPDHTNAVTKQYAWVDMSLTDVGVVLTSPKINVSSLTVPSLSFWIVSHNNTNSVTVYNKLFVEAFNGTTFQVIDSIQGDFGLKWENFIFDLSSHKFNTDSVQVRFRMESGGDINDYDNDILLDDVEVKEAPSCFATSIPSATNLTAFTADIFWVDVNTSSTWQIQFDTTGFTLGTGVSTFVTSDSVTIPSLTPNTTYDVYVRAICGAGDSSAWSSKVTFTTPPTCPKPSTLIASNISTSAATVKWTDNSTATSWQVDYGMGAHTAGTGTLVLSSADSLILTGLTANTSYNYFVRAICAVGDTSDWSIVGSFKTLCSVYTSPYSEDFSTYVPSCWNEAQGRLKASTTTTGTSSSWIADGFLNVGTTGSARMNIYGTTADEWLISPSFDLGTSATSFQLEFDAGLTDFSGSGTDLMGPDDSLAIVISTDNGLTWSTTDILKLYTATNQPSNTGENVIIDLSAYTGQVKIGFYAASSVSNTDYNVYIDNFAINPLASCLQPSALASAALTYTSVDFYWLENGTATSWQIQHDTAAFTIGTGTKSIVPTDSVTISGLTANTSYDVYVRSICGAGDTSSWAGPYTFFTGYCSVSTTSTIDYLSAVSSSGAVTNVSYTATAQAPGSYSDETAQLITSFPTGSFDITTTYVGGGHGVNIWVDWNNDLDFDDAGELVSSVNNSNLTKTASLVVPAAAASGNYRMRIRAEWGSSANPPACGSVTYGSTIDFTLVVGAAPACLAVTALSTAAISFNSADIYWTENNSSTSWQIEYDTTAFVQGTGNSSIVLSDSITLSPLTPSTTYDVYVRSICGAGDTSSWAGPITFSTPCAPITAPYLEGFDGLALTSPYTTLPNCWETQSGPDFWDVTNDVVNNGHTYLPNIGDHTTGTTNYMWIDASGDITANEMVSPLIDISSLSAPIAGFWFASDNTTNSVNHTISLDVWDGSAWVHMIDTAGNFAGWIEVSASVPSSIPSITKFRIQAIPDTGTTSATYFYNDLGVDDFFVYDLPTCVMPGSLSDSLLTSNSVDMHWVENGTATLWQIEYDTAGFTPGTGMIDTTSSIPYSITGLNSQTAYQFYVRAICGPGDSSFWVGPYNFTTLCSPFTAPFLETFQTNSTPICWTESGDNSWEFGSNVTTPAGFADYAADNVPDHTGTNGTFIGMDGSDNGSGEVSTLTTPLVDVSSLNRAELTFWMFSNNTNDAARNKTIVEAYDGTQWVQLDSIQGNLDTTWVEMKYSLAALNITALTQVRFTVTGDTVGSPFYNDILFDDIQIDEEVIAYQPIGNINKEDTNGVADKLGNFYWTSGTVAGVDLDGNNGISFTIIDNSSSTPEGMNIFNFNDVSNYVVNEGDSIMVRGEIQQFNGLTELFPDSISIISTGAYLPPHALVTTLDESTESALIRMENMTVTNVPSGTSKNISITDGTTTFTMRVDADTDVLDSLTFNVGDVLCYVNGIGGQFDNSLPYTSGYQIFPMRYTDIAFAPSVDLGADTMVCDTNGFMLDAGTWVSYSWNTGDTTQMITPDTSMTQYIVTVMDSNGCTGTDTINVTVTICTSINDNNLNTANINFYPNPSKGQFRMEISGVQSAQSNLEILNVNGQVVYNNDLLINGSIIKDIDINVEPGIYFVKLSNSNGVKVKKLIIE